MSTSETAGAWIVAGLLLLAVAAPAWVLPLGGLLVFGPLVAIGALTGLGRLIGFARRGPRSPPPAGVEPPGPPGR